MVNHNAVKIGAYFIVLILHLMFQNDLPELIFSFSELYSIHELCIPSDRGMFYTPTLYAADVKPKILSLALRKGNTSRSK